MQCALFRNTNSHGWEVIPENCNIRHVEASWIRMHLAYNSCLGEADNDFLGLHCYMDCVCAQ